MSQEASNAISEDEVESIVRKVLAWRSDGITEIFARHATNGTLEAEWMHYYSSCRLSYFAYKIKLEGASGSDLKESYPGPSNTFRSRRDAARLFTEFENAKRVDPEWTELKVSGSDGVELAIRSYRPWTSFVADMKSFFIPDFWG